MKLTEKKISKTHRTLVYGEPKSGKTELAVRLAEKYHILFFDLENGYETALKLPHDWQERIEIVSIPDTKVYPVAIETMLKVVTGAPTNICDTHGKVDCALCKKAGETFTRVCLNELSDDWIVVIDSLTQLSNSAMNHITKTEPDTYKPEWPDYRAQGQLLDKFLSQVQQASYNVICITHVTETELEDGKKRLVPVAGTTNFSRNTAKYFDHVVYCEVKNRKHNFSSSTVFSNNVLTGSRTDVEVEKLDKPTLLSIYTEMKEAPKETPKEVQDVAVKQKVLTPATAEIALTTVTNVAHQQVTNVPTQQAIQAPTLVVPPVPVTGAELLARLKGLHQK